MPSRKLLHIIAGLPVGGAQTALQHVVAHSPAHGFESVVVSLTDAGAVGQVLQDRFCVRVEALNLQPGRLPPLSIFRLAKLIRDHRPTIVQTWMYHADLLGGIASRIAGGDVPVVWNIRQSNLEAKFHKRTTMLTAKACAQLSRWLPARIISNSEVAKKAHEAWGFDRQKISVIPNGVDVAYFAPQPLGAARVRDELRMPPSCFLVGYVARWDPLKDHECFAVAAGRFKRICPDARFLLCGEGITTDNEILVKWLEAAGLIVGESVYLLGLRRDLPSVFSALDVATSTSRGEGFPNAIAEAQACGVPCATTAAGDSAIIVNDSSRVFGMGDVEGLLKVWSAIRELGPDAQAALRSAVRDRIVRQYGVEAMVSQYYDLYGQLVFAHAPSLWSTPRRF